MLAELGGMGGGYTGISGGMSVLARLYKRVLSLSGSWLWAHSHCWRSSEGLCASLHRKPPEGALIAHGCKEQLCRVTGVLPAM